MKTLENGLIELETLEEARALPDEKLADVDIGALFLRTMKMGQVKKLAEEIVSVVNDRARVYFKEHTDSMAANVIAGIDTVLLYRKERAAGNDIAHLEDPAAHFQKTVDYLLTCRPVIFMQVHFKVTDDLEETHKDDFPTKLEKMKVFHKLFVRKSLECTTGSPTGYLGDKPYDPATAPRDLRTRKDHYIPDHLDPDKN